MPITLLTDFGTTDHYVAAMKGVLLSRCPNATIVDITHDIPPQDIAAAAYALLSVYREFPTGTIHVAVVDPGVGSNRRPIVVAAGGQFFVGPDNGLFSGPLREPHAEVTHIANDAHFRHPVSGTFHGRDVFAPTAAALANGLPPSELGPRIEDPVRLSAWTPERLEGGSLRGTVLHVDRFGNLVTNIRAEDLISEFTTGGWRLEAGGQVIDTLRRTYAESTTPGEPVLIWGSGGFLEIAVNGGSAAEQLKIGRGALIEITAHAGKSAALLKTK